MDVNMAFVCIRVEKQVDGQRLPLAATREPPATVTALKIASRDPRLTQGKRNVGEA